MNQEVQKVIRLQSLDQRIAALQKDIAELPKQIAKIEKTLDSQIRKLDIDRAALISNQKERKKLEGDIQLQEQKISKFRGQMAEAKNNEQYRAFQHEIDFCEKEVRRAEDRTLELMGESEPLDQSVKKAEAALKNDRALIEIEMNTAKDRSAKDQGFLAEAQKQRLETLGSLSRETTQLYDRIRKKWRGTVIADGTEGRCTACNMVLRPQFMQDLKMSDKLLQCESCGRILYYNAPVRVEA